jgi:hypothetical protein
MRGDRRFAADVEAGGILQHHITIGLEISENLRGIRIVDFVPDQRG